MTTAYDVKYFKVVCPSHNINKVVAALTPEGALVRAIYNVSWAVAEDVGHGGATLAEFGAWSATPTTSPKARQRIRKTS